MAGTLTTTQAACHVPEFWSTKTRDAVEANVVAAGLVDQTFTAKLKGGPGDTMNIPYISNPTASTRTQNANVTLEVIGPSAAEASQSFTVATHQIVAFAVENITDVQAMTDMAGKYTKKGGYALGAAADTNLHTLPQNFSQTVGTAGLEPTDDNYKRAAQYLDDALAPDDERFIIMRPATWYSALSIDRFSSTTYGSTAKAENAIERAMVGTIYKFGVYKTTLVRAPSAGQADNWACHKLGVYYCSQQLKTNPPVWSPERDSDVVTMTHIYGYAEALQPPVTAGGGAATDVFNVLLSGTS